MMAKSVWIFAAVALLANICEAYNVLVIFPIPSKSHCILGENIVKHLLQAGHEVTYITAIPIKDSHSKLQQVDVSSHFELLSDDLLSIKSILDEEPLWKKSLNFMLMLGELPTKTLEHPNVVKLLNDTSINFDLVINEWLMTELFAGLAVLYDSPLIWFNSVEPNWMLLNLIDESTNPAYISDALLNINPPFSFLERVQGLVIQWIGKAMKYFWVDIPENQNYERVIVPYLKQRGREVPSYDEVRYSAAMVLGNSHISLGQAMTLPQNCKLIGGYHIDKDVKPLPNDLKNILDNAKNGLIYFSMGSNLQSKTTPDVLKKGLLKMFGELKQTVLWKFEEALPDTPSNVHIVHWAPQQSILAHPKCVLFITHGGFLSTIETVHFGKPIIGIPVFGDQFANVDSAVRKGYAKKVDLSYSMVGELKTAIGEVLQDSKYSDKVKQLSQIYHDRPVSPKAELVHWVEHVIRTGGAPHLRSPALHVPFYQKLYLDFIGLILIVIIAIKMLIVRLFCSKRNKTALNIKKKKNN